MDARNIYYQALITTKNISLFQHEETMAPHKSFHFFLLISCFSASSVKGNFRGLYRKVEGESITERKTITQVRNLKGVIDNNADPIPESDTSKALLSDTLRETKSPSVPSFSSAIIHNVIMTFDNCLTLNNASLTVWQDVTTSFVKKAIFINLKASEVLFTDVEVGIDYRSQIVPESPTKISSIAPYGHERASELNQLSPLYILFNAVIKLKSLDQRHNLTSTFIDALNTEPKLVAYLKELSSYGDPAFGTINQVMVDFSGTATPRVDSFFPRKSSCKKSFLKIIGLSAVASFCLGIAIMTTFRLRHFGKRSICEESIKGSSVDISQNDMSQKVIMGHDHMCIEVAYDDDVSTLGDFWTQTNEMFDDPTVGDCTIKCATVFQNYMNGNDDDSVTVLSKHPPSCITVADYTIRDDFSVISASTTKKISVSGDSLPEPETSPEPNYGSTMLRYSETDCCGVSCATR